MFSSLPKGKIQTNTIQEHRKGIIIMAENKQPHEKMTDKNNGLSDTQEVLYSEDFKKADKAADTEKEDEKQEDD